jgi:hypothetical protein
MAMRIIRDGIRFLATRDDPERVVRQRQLNRRRLRRAGV